MQKKINLLCLFDYAAFTGFATVSKNLVNNWMKIFGDKIQIDIVAVNYFGNDYNEHTNVRVISAKLKDVKGDDFGRHVFLKTANKGSYDVLFIMQDIGIVQPCISHLQTIINSKKLNKHKLFRTIFYFPIDVELLPKLTHGLGYFDFLATYTEFGKQEVLKYRPELKNKIEVIPHGNNSNNFYPLPLNEIREFKNEYFGNNADKFIVGCVNRNQSRKDIPTTILGFLEYKMNYNDDCLLYLHMNPKDPMGWHLPQIFEQTPLKEGIDYMFPSEEDFNKGASVEKLNKIINCFDVFLTTATGGGWELTVTEAMGCKVPTIIPKHTSFLTLGGANGENTYFLEDLYPVVAMTDNLIRNQCDLYEIASKLDNVQKRIFQESKAHKHKIEDAYKFVEKLNWKDIAKRFADKIKELG
jgi:glycosyltransferase involved in cell wall biosynthesis